MTTKKLKEIKPVRVFEFEKGDVADIARTLNLLLAALQEEPHANVDIDNGWVCLDCYEDIHCHGSRLKNNLGNVCNCNCTKENGGQEEPEEKCICGGLVEKGKNIEHTLVHCGPTEKKNYRFHWEEEKCGVLIKIPSDPCLYECKNTKGKCPLHDKGLPVFSTAEINLMHDKAYQNVLKMRVEEAVKEERKRVKKWAEGRRDYTHRELIEFLNTDI